MWFEPAKTQETPTEDENKDNSYHLMGVNYVPDTTPSALMYSNSVVLMTSVEAGVTLPFYRWWNRLREIKWLARNWHLFFLFEQHTYLLTTNQLHHRLCMSYSCVYVCTCTHEEDRSPLTSPPSRPGQGLVILTQIGKSNLTQLIVRVWQESCPSTPLYKWKLLLLIPSDLK